jgi:hypothetical protein
VAGDRLVGPRGFVGPWDPMLSGWGWCFGGFYLPCSFWALEFDGRALACLVGISTGPSKTPFKIWSTLILD